MKLQENGQVYLLQWQCVVDLDVVDLVVVPDVVGDLEVDAVVDLVFEGVVLDLVVVEVGLLEVAECVVIDFVVDAVVDLVVLDVTDDLVVVVCPQLLVVGVWSPQLLVVWVPCPELLVV